MAIARLTLRPDQKDILLLLGLALLCYADKILLGPLASIDIYDSLEVHFAHFQSMWRLWAEYGPFSWYPFHAGGVPSFVGQHPPWHPAVFLAGVLPLWLLSLLWNISQMFLAGYGIYRFLPLLLGASRRSAFVVAVLYSLTWISGNVHFVMPYAFPAVFVWCVELFRRETPRSTKLRAASFIALASLFSFPVLTLPHFPIFHLALVLFLGRHLPDFRRQVAGVFIIWTGYVLLFVPSIVSLFLYIPYTQREWDFSFTGLGPALLDYLRWLRGRLADQQLIPILLLGLPLLTKQKVRVCYAFILVMLLVAGAFTCDLKGLFHGSFLLKMDLFMFATCLGIVGAMIASQVLDALAESDAGIRWPWVLAVVAALPLLGAAHKVLTYVAILGAGLAAVALMRAKRHNSGTPQIRINRPAIALMICLAAMAMLVRQQNMTSGMFAPYAQGMLGHQDLAAMATKSPERPFRVACVDVHPVVAQNLGLDTVGGKSPLFNKYYKEVVREAIRPQFANPMQIQAFDNLWRQLYLTRIRVDLDQRSWVLSKAPPRSVADFNWNALRALNVTHVVASREMTDMSSVAALPVLSPGFGESSELLTPLGLRDRFALPLYIYELKDPLPRVYLAEPTFRSSRQEVLEALGQSELPVLQRQVFLLQEDVRGFPPPAPLQRYVPESGLSIGAAHIVSWSPDKIRIKGLAERPCVLVMANNFDPNWKAVLPGGKVLPTFRANHAFTGVFIDEPGPFLMDLTYSNPLIWWLNLSSAFGLGLMFCGVFWGVGGNISTLKDEPTPLLCSALPTWRACLLTGTATAAVWTLAFALFVYGKQKGPQAESFPYALATIPVLGFLVACWTRNFLRRF
ncbi:MAG: hypothetical protein Q8O35_07045 [Humidesulfovibrio sp.]|uniref:hypothetical protein n=1 Tax=Humidesulfovibrio sp. TaxID=2910988 RepID=UPI002735041E|nr:hypothetical protein [Humidesulfovibrio sp.]MDP2847932.1 hypothetical protein [Humidesulfovibrio sp.]